MTVSLGETFADIHQAAFKNTRAWSAEEFTRLLASPHVFSVSDPSGFALGRVVLDEVELLTIAVRPKAHGKGIGRHLLSAFEAEACKRGATRAFLEVAQDNSAALALYLTSGWSESGRRVGYYARDTGENADAIIMEKHLTQGEPPEN